MKEKIKKERRNKNMKGKRGITLIALIITIIVMLILVAVTINIAISGGLFGTAKKAVRKTDVAKLQEEWMMTKYADYNTTTGRTNVQDGPLSDVFGNKYEQYNDQFAIEDGELVYIGTDEIMKQYATELGIAMSSGLFTANTKYTDKKGEEAIIPKGFKLLTEGQKVSDGLVIQDANGNEFVWIPVTYTKKNTDTNNNGYDDGFDEVFYRSDWTDGERTPLEAGYHEPDTEIEEDVAEYNAMMASVAANKGFYIGRYEAGLPDQSDGSASQSIVAKRNRYPFTDLCPYPAGMGYDPIGAKARCRNLYQQTGRQIWCHEHFMLWGSMGCCVSVCKRFYLRCFG